MKPTLLMTVGLPRSGKSTFVRGLKHPICSPDEIRKFHGCYPFDPKMETRVWADVAMMIHTLFASGAKTVVLDATNVTKFRRDSWRSEKWNRAMYLFRTEAVECLKRLDDTNQYLGPVIARMDAMKEWPTAEELDTDEEIVDIQSHSGVVKCGFTFWRDYIKKTGSDGLEELQIVELT